MKAILALLTLFTASWFPSSTDKTVYEKTTSITVMEDAKSETSKMIRNVQSAGVNGRYVITGEGRIKGGNLFYTVEDGHNELAKGIVPVKAKEWTSFKFEINIPQEKLPQNGSVILYLYGKEENETKPFPVLLEQRKS